MHLMEQKYRCKECEFSTDYVAHTWKHSLNQHPDGSTEMNVEQNENGIILKLVAEQNAEIIEELGTIKQEFTGAFEKLAEVVSSIKNDSNDKCKTVADTVMKLYGKISKIQAKSKPTGHSKAKEMLQDDKKQKPVIKSKEDTKSKPDTKSKADTKS